MSHHGPHDPYRQPLPQDPPHPHGQQYIPRQVPPPGYPTGPGQPPYYPPQLTPQQWATRHNWAGLTALILSIIAVVADLTLILTRVGMLLGLGGILLAGVGLSKIRIGTANNRTIAMTAMILGLVALVGAIAVNLALRNT